MSRSKSPLAILSSAMRIDQLIAEYNSERRIMGATISEPVISRNQQPPSMGEKKKNKQTTFLASSEGGLIISFIYFRTLSLWRNMLHTCMYIHESSKGERKYHKRLTTIMLMIDGKEIESFCNKFSSQKKLQVLIIVSRGGKLIPIWNIRLSIYSSNCICSGYDISEPSGEKVRLQQLRKISNPTRVKSFSSYFHPFIFFLKKIK